jgi:hypothetical protein
MLEQYQVTNNLSEDLVEEILSDLFHQLYQFTQKYSLPKEEAYAALTKNSSDDDKSHHKLQKIPTKVSSFLICYP